MTVDPRLGAWVNFVFLILSGVAAGAVSFGHLPLAVVDDIKTGAGWGIFLITSANMVFHLFSAPTSGPMSK